MKVHPSTQYKAAFLTIVFLLNTIIGFACAVGLDLGFNTCHHQNQEIVHPTSNIKESKTPHDHTKHSHDENSTDHHASKDSKDNCCKDEVAKLIKADKLHQPGFDYGLLSLPVFTLPLTDYLASNSNVFPVNIPNTYFVWHYRPPISDVRIAIQSFQI